MTLNNSYNSEYYHVSSNGNARKIDISASTKDGVSNNFSHADNYQLDINSTGNINFNNQEYYNSKHNFVPNRGLFNNHPIALKQIYDLSAIHRRAVNTISSLIAGMGIAFTDMAGNPLLPESKEHKMAYDYLKRTGYLEAHKQIAFDMYLYGGSAMLIIEKFDRVSMRIMVEKIRKKEFCDFRISVPKYDETEYKGISNYHYYTNAKTWEQRGITCGNSPNTSISDIDVTSIDTYNPNDRFKKIVFVPSWKNDAKKRKGNLVSSLYLPCGSGGVYYQDALYESREFYHAVEALFEMARHINGIIKNEFTAQYIMVIRRAAYSFSPESEEYRDTLKQDSEDISESMIQKGNHIIYGRPTNEDGESGEGSIEIKPIPKADGKSNDKINTANYLRTDVALAHGIHEALLGVNNSGNSLSNQGDYLNSCFNMLHNFTIDPIQQKICSDLINGILLTPQNGFDNIKAVILPYSADSIMPNNALNMVNTNKNQ